MFTFTLSDIGRQRCITIKQCARVAIGLVIVSDVALILLAIRDKVLVKTYLDQTKLFFLLRAYKTNNQRTS